jgi:hypothetical protein
VTERELADWLGVTGGILATIGSILLAYPLFHLLRAREAIEDLEIAEDEDNTSERVKHDIRVALRDLKQHVRRKRTIAINVGAAGFVLLAIGLLFLVFQALSMRT